MPELTTKDCDECGTPFTTNLAYKKYCNPSCQLKFSMKTHKLRRRRIRKSKKRLPKPRKPFSLRPPLEVRAVVRKIAQQVKYSAEACLHVAVIRNALEELYNEELRNGAVAYFTGDMWNAEILQLDPDWIRRLLKEVDIDYTTPASGFRWK